MKSFLIVAICLFALTFLEVAINRNGGTEKVSFNNNAALFLNYVSAFDQYYVNNKGETGDVTYKVILPQWLPRESSIRMYIVGGYGYVFMPSSSGMLSDIMKTTDNSALVGFSDGSSIISLVGRLAKPSIIPPGYIVYVR